MYFVQFMITPLQWHQNERDYVSNHQPHGCILNRLSRRRSRKTSKLSVTGLYAGNSPVTVKPPHKGPVTRKMFPFDDVIMIHYLRSPLSASILHKTLYHNISQSFEAARLCHKSVDHWNLTGGSVAQFTMMTSSNGNIFRVTGLLCGEFIGPG